MDVMKWNRLEMRLKGNQELRYLLKRKYNFQRKVDENICGLHFINYGKRIT